MFRRLTQRDLQGEMIVGSLGAYFRAGVVGGMLCIGATAAWAQSAPYHLTTYNFAPASMTWITCGATGSSAGCYGHGTIGGFGKICAVLQDPDTPSGDAEHNLYVLDSDYQHQGNVVLHVIRMRVKTTNDYITTTFRKLQVVGLSLQGGRNVRCQAAANANVIIAGTGTSTNAMEITKGSFATSSIGGFSPPETVTSIVADDAGYIAVDFTGGFYLFGANGSAVEFGGGSAHVVPGDNAFIP